MLMYIAGKKIRNLIVTTMALLLIVGLMGGVAKLATNSTSSIWDKLGQVLALQDLGQDMLLRGMPGMNGYNNYKDSSFDYPGEMIQQAMGNLSKVTLGDPKVFLSSQLSYLQVMGRDNTGPPTEEEIIFFERDYTIDDLPPQELNPELVPGQEESRTIVTTGEPLVAIYNSHNGETYTPDAGVPRIDGSNGGVVQVAEELAKALEEVHGIPTVRSERVHDYPSYAMSYANSLKTVEEILAKHPSVEIVIDIHRDYQPTKAQTTARVAGEDVARLLFVVGNDARQVHPRWRQNLAFVNSIENKMNQMYPELARGVRQQDGRYNQHLHPRAILVEMGSAENTMAEAKASAKLLADVLAELLVEIQQQQGTI